MAEYVLAVSGASGSVLAARFAAKLLAASPATLHVIVTSAGSKVLAHELGPEWATARGFVEQLALNDQQRARVWAYSNHELTAPVASGSYPVNGVVVLPCSAGTAGALANGISRGLVQRVADVAIKQRWPLLLGIRETPMSPILLGNLQRLAQIGVHVVPPMPAFYLVPDEAAAMSTFIDHYCMRLLDLLGIETAGAGLRWKG